MAMKSVNGSPKMWTSPFCTIHFYIIEHIISLHDCNAKLHIGTLALIGTKYSFGLNGLYIFKTISCILEH